MNVLERIKEMNEDELTRFMSKTTSASVLGALNGAGVYIDRETQREQFKSNLEFHRKVLKQEWDEEWEDIVKDDSL